MDCLTAQLPYYVNATIYGDKENFIVPEKIGIITEDKDGIIWIGSENGLFSFNGTQFRNYRHSTKDSGSLPGNYVKFIYQDRQHVYWAAIHGKGLYKFDPATEKFSQYHYSNEQQFNIHHSHEQEIGLPFEDSRNRLWVPLASYGLAEIDREHNRVIPYKICFPNSCGGFYTSSWVTRITEGINGELWLATNDGLVRFDPVAGRATRLEGKGTTFNYFGPRIGDDLWIGTWGDGIKKFNLLTHTFETFFWSPYRGDGTKNICVGIYQKDDRHLWVSTLEKELFLFDVVTHRCQPVRQTGNEASDFHADYCFQARDRSLWLTQFPSRLVKINASSPFNTYVFTNDRVREPSLFSATCFLRCDDRLYIGTSYSCGLAEYNTADQTYRELPIPGPGVKQTNFLVPGPGGKGFYAGGEYGLVFYNTGERRYEPPAGDTAVRRLLRRELYCGSMAPDESLWLGGYAGSILHYFPRTGKVLSYDISCPQYNYNMEDRVMSIALSNDGVVWFSHNPLGLGCLRPADGKVVYFNGYRNKDYPTGKSTSVCVAADGSILFTVLPEGLWQLKAPFTDEEACLDYDRLSGLPADYIRYVFQDRKKRTWLYSTNGLSLFDPVTGSCASYAMSDGLKNNSLFYPPYQDPQGAIYIGYQKAFQTFDPDSLLRRDGPSGKMMIHAFKVNGKAWPRNVNFLTSLQLQPGQRNIEIQYAAVTHGNPQQLKYLYRLEGYDTGWVHAGSHTNAVYNNLPAGDFTWKVRLEGNEAAVFTLPLSISDYWYNTIWVKAAAVLLILTISYLFYRGRIRFNKKMAEVEMRALRAQMNPHFIFNCLASINRYIVKSDTKTASGYLTRFSKLIRQILDNSSADAVTIETEIQTLRLYLDMESLRFDHAFDYEIEVNGLSDTAGVHIPSMLIQPYVENAIWHGLLQKEEKGKLWVRFIGVGDQRLRVEIEDNGIGRAKAEELRSKDSIRQKSYGMQISRDRIKLINSIAAADTSVSVIDLAGEEGEGAGTCVILQIPLT